METRRKAYDKELIRERTLDVLAHYLQSSGRNQGSRMVWDCPSCGKSGKFAVKKTERKGGCLTAGCRLEGYEDVFSIVARFEDLDYRTDFLQVLEKTYEVLGMKPEEVNSRSGRRSSNAKRSRGVPVTTRAVSLRTRPGRYAEDGGSETHNEAGVGGAHAPDHGEVRAIAACAYARIMALCPLESRDRGYLRKRGFSYETIKRGRFGTMTAARAREVKAALVKELGREALLLVPGFSEDGETGRIKFTLAGDYLLIPYHDAEGRITTIEGRAAGKIPEGMGKYVSLRRAGNHLYVFPGHGPGDLLAICEGVMGAVAAAEAGLAVGGIQGCERYRASLSPDFPDGEPGEPLLELKGTDFGGRLLPYVPDADDPPNPRVLRAAPKAARWLAEPHNARHAICLLPEGKDLDEWLLSLHPNERRRRFEELLGSTNPPEDWGYTLESTTGRAAPSSTGATKKPDAGENGCRNGRGPSGETAPGTSEDQARPARKLSRGVRRLCDEVYRALLEALPPKEAHLEALSHRGVMRETALIGNLGSLDGMRARDVAGKLVKRFGAKRLLTVPGFERAGSASVGFALGGEYLLFPSFDGEGLLSAVQALPVDGEAGEIPGEETVPLPGAGDHLYVFAAYRPDEVEGFCEGPLGALLAAQEDVVVGAIAGFRRYGPGSDYVRDAKEGAAAGLPELDGVDLSGRELAYVPRVVIGEENARYHEAERAARWLIERQGGRPRVAGVRDSEPEGGPTSLAEWILSLREDETQHSLRELFLESPRRRSIADARQQKDGSGEQGSSAGREQPTDRWRMHETPRKSLPSRAPVTLSEAVLVALAWPLVYLATGWLLGKAERLLVLAGDLGMASEMGPLVAYSTPASAAAATLMAAFVLWRRRAMRVGEARMLAGKIEH